MDYENNYLLAIKNMNLRQSFIDSIELGWAEQYMPKCIYKNRLSKSKKNILMSTKRLSILSSENKSKVLIYPVAFDLKFHPNFQDFYSTLVYHEGQHAKENFIGLPMPTCVSVESIEYWSAFDLLQEVRAVRNQLLHLTKENSEAFQVRLEERLNNHLRQLSKGGCNEFVELYGDP